MFFINEQIDMYEIRKGKLATYLYNLFLFKNLFKTK